MRILIVDDTEINQQSARKTLEGHDLTIVSTYDEAVEMLQLEAPSKAVDAEMKRLGMKQPVNSGWSPDSHEKWKPYLDKAREVAKQLVPAPFDAVLLDLFMPASGYAQTAEGQKLVGQLMPVGFPLIFLAALGSGAKFIGLVTATNHHVHPMAASIDRLWGKVFALNGAKMAFFHTEFIGVEGTICDKCNGAKCYRCKKTGLGQGKDWGKVLASLTTK